jgi:hypothetical protein
MPSQPVRSLGALSGLQKYVRHGFTEQVGDHIVAGETAHGPRELTRQTVKCTPSTKLEATSPAAKTWRLADQLYG